jgi:glutamyl-tRNA(Gln) amidotransferase subunit E
VQPGVTFAREFADRLRVIACLVDRPFMVHSDLGAYFLSAADWRDLRSRLRASEDDAMVVLWGSRRDAETAAREVLIRGADALQGVPAETRQAYPDGTNGFERILPGPDRMYPDTDTPPLPIPDAWVAELAATPAERPWEREARYEASGLPPASARRLAASDWSGLFDALDPQKGDVACRLAHALEKRIPHLRRLGALDGLPQPPRLEPLVRAVEAGEILPDGIEPALDALVEEVALDAETALEPFRSRPDDDDELERRVVDVLGRAVALAGKPAETKVRWAMGEVLRDRVGRLDPARVLRVLRERLPVEAEEAS